MKIGTRVFLEILLPEVAGRVVPQVDPSVA